MDDCPEAALAAQIASAVAANGGWLPFDRYMQLALYAPGLGYYSRGAGQIGRMPQGGSDFVTAPVLSPLFGRALSVQVAQAIAGCGSAEIWEFGAGTGALAEQVIDGLAEQMQPLAAYHIVDISGALREWQTVRLARFGALVQWHDTLPEHIDGVVLGNEVLDAMPVQLLHLGAAGWLERGVAVAPGRVADAADLSGIANAAGMAHAPGIADAAGTAGAAVIHFAWSDRPTTLRPPEPADAPGHFPPGATIELPTHAIAFVDTLSRRLRRGAAFFIDYGFPAHEFYHPQRHAGTLMCHRGHLADADPLQATGGKDITAHVDFTAVALAAQEVGCDVLGYTTQARFLINCGLIDRLHGADLPAIAGAQRLLAEHEMGELFKVIGWARGCAQSFTADPVGFRDGDRTHTL